MTQSHSHSPFSSFTSKDPKFVPATMSLDLIYFGTHNRNLTALHVYCCAVLTKNVLLQQLPLYLRFHTYFIEHNKPKRSVLNSSQSIVSNKLIKNISFAFLQLTRQLNCDSCSKWSRHLECFAECALTSLLVLIYKCQAV